MKCRYHSHPIFAPKPSQKDNENQRNYQALFRCDKTRLEPFVGAIVGPYDMQLPTQVCHYLHNVSDPGLAACRKQRPCTTTARSMSALLLPQDLRSLVTLNQHAKDVLHLPQHDSQQPGPAADQPCLLAKVKVISRSCAWTLGYWWVCICKIQEQ